MIPAQLQNILLG